MDEKEGTNVMSGIPLPCPSHWPKQVPWPGPIPEGLRGIVLPFSGRRTTGVFVKSAKSALPLTVKGEANDEMSADLEGY